MENALDRVHRDSVIRPRLAHSGRQNEAQHAATRFLIGMHRFQQNRWRNARPRRQRAEPGNQRYNARNVFRASETELVSKKNRGHHAPRDSFAMLITTIMRNAFESVRKSVAEIQDLAQTGFALIAADDARLDLHIAGDERSKRVSVAPQDLVKIPF